jgi:hypothetical protein
MRSPPWAFAVGATNSMALPRGFAAHVSRNKFRAKAINLTK